MCESLNICSLSDINRVSGRRPVLCLTSLRLYLACFLCLRLTVRGSVILELGGIWECPRLPSGASVPPAVRGRSAEEARTYVCGSVESAPYRAATARKRLLPWAASRNLPTAVAGTIQVSVGARRSVRSEEHT